MHHQPAAETAEILCTTADLFPEARLRLQAGRRWRTTGPSSG